MTSVVTIEAGASEVLPHFIATGATTAPSNETKASNSHAVQMTPVVTVADARDVVPDLFAIGVRHGQIQTVRFLLIYFFDLTLLI